MKNEIVLLIIIIAFLAFLMIVKESGNHVADPYGNGKDFHYVLRATGSDEESFVGNLTKLLEEDIEDFAKGDILLILGRLKNDSSVICDSVTYYEKSLPVDPEQGAVIHETIASLDCGKDVKDHLLKASEMWKAAGSVFRSELDRHLALNETFTIETDTRELPEFNLTIPDNPESIIIGNSEIDLGKHDVLVSQTDRVTRDWLSYQIFSSPFQDSGPGELLTEYELNRKNLLTTFSERLTYDDEELLPEIGWHEGARIREIRETGLTHKTASGTIVFNHEGKWYAPDEEGVFRFEVPIDKVLYPTTRFLRDDIAVIIDTHGINMIVEQAIRNNATVVVGCCDNPGKIKAAMYLAVKGIKTICFTDKYLPLILGSGFEILGSPPIRREGDIVVIGDRPLEFETNETFVVMGMAGDKFALSYYDTPKIYFDQLSESIDLDIEHVTIDDFDQMGRIIEKAEEIGSNAVAVRVFTSQDYRDLKGWLEADEKRRAILFHSVSYPYGYRIMKEFPEQTTFDDINPLIS
ncbi:MAG: hypothetical protein JW754_01700 [Candidatus Aenigmarchaeota archaeon]|nr:hypothetical protein [Candidatus Aenigmarchaeota archaeon]